MESPTTTPAEILSLITSPQVSGSDDTGQHAAGSVTVIVSALGADVQPVAAHLAGEVADGLAIRVIDHDPDMLLTDRPDRHRRMLPTAWRNPEANLAIVGSWSLRRLIEDVEAVEATGAAVRHRLTLAARPHRTFGDTDHLIGTLGEIGDVGVQARDAVLRAGGHVLIEADDPAGAGADMTAIRALVAADIPPWATYVADLTIWLTVSADVPFLDDLWLVKIRRAVRVNGGPPPLPGNVAMMIALTDITEHWPALAGRDTDSYNLRSGGLKAVRAGGVLAAKKALGALISRIEATVGVPVALVTTGPDTAIDLR